MDNYIKENNNSILSEELKEDIYQNKEILDTLNSALFSLNLGRSIIITGQKGSGKSLIARLLSKIYNISIKKEESDYYYYICTNQTKYST